MAPVVRATGERAVLKLGMPHMEAAHELHGLRFWDGDPTVRLLEADVDLNAMLLEACDSGVTLRSLPAPEQDLLIARLLRRLWRRPTPPHPFRPSPRWLLIGQRRRVEPLPGGPMRHSCETG